MRVAVNDVRLFVDIEGAGLVPDGPEMREKPVLIVLHGGPGADHSIFKPGFSQLADVCQILYLDHRGNGRSDNGDPADWTLAQWADDIDALCNVLGIDRPIIYGASFGGFVAQAFATRYPERPGGLILSNTAARVDFDMIYDAFARVGGDAARQAAQNYWGSPTSETRRAYGEICVPYYARRPIDPDFWARVIMKDPVALHFNGPNNEMGRFDFRAGLGQVACPALVLSGADDPIMPPEFSDTIAESLAARAVQTRRFADASHMTASDVPEAYFDLVRDFIKGIET